ncbi:uncharacterized protein LOC123550350 isoform X2 [Mercenaria mercenaria]|uniref:uncharacterized protein LOC123550350 isoform X2 n=1 Tax=Mercenaria mercenaria TaxID=6596 RepID=UPI00234E6388|nr:uncharacterized protein LOC123550350 isoform X2 [Mercenaria mercenaria]
MVSVIVFVFVFLEILPGYFSDTEIQPNDYQQICSPFKAYIIWDRSKGKDAFDVQVHYVLQIIEKTPEGTSIRLDTVDKKFRNIIDFIKDNDEKRVWRYSITNVTRRKSEHDIISYKSLKEAISNSFQKSEKAAEEIFFIVNNNSKTDDEEKAMKELKRRKVFVVLVFDGTKSPQSEFWANLATDIHHVLEPNKNTDANADAFLNLPCRDSRLYCDTDLYWNGTGCSKCSFICSQIPSEYCQIECPYFDQFTGDVEKSDELPDSHGCTCTTTTIVVLILIIIIQCILIFILILKICFPSQVLNLFQRIMSRLNKRREPIPEEEIAQGNRTHLLGDIEEGTLNKNGKRDETMATQTGGRMRRRKKKKRMRHTIP